MADTSYVKPGDVPVKFWSAAVAAAEKYKVDPYLLAAIGKHETGFGTLGAGRDGYSMGYGVWTEGEPSTKWKDNPGEFTNQVNGAAKQISNYLGSIPTTAISIKDFQTNSWKPGDSEWGEKVWNAYKGLNPNLDPVLNWGSDPKGAAEDLKESVTDGARGIAAGVTYVVVILAVVGVVIFSANKAFSINGAVSAMKEVTN